MTFLHFSPGLRPGSINQLAADLAVGLQQQKEGQAHTNILLSPNNELTSQLPEIEHHNISENQGLLTFVRQIVQLKREAEETQTDVVIAYGQKAIRIALIALQSLLKKHRRPHLVGVLTGFPNSFMPSLSLSRCSAIYTISAHLADELKKIYSQKPQGNWSSYFADLFSGTFISTIPYGVHVEQCNPLYEPSPEWIEEWKRSYPVAPETTTICIPCPISSEIHGLEYLPQIILGLQKQGITPHVYLTGDLNKATRKTRNKLRRLFEPEGVSEHITWLGLRQDLRNILKVTDIVLSLATKPTSHNRPILEALALGRPVIGFAHGAVGEMIESFYPKSGAAIPLNEPTADAKKPSAGHCSYGVEGVIKKIIEWKTTPPQTISHPIDIPSEYNFETTVKDFESALEEVSRCK